MTVGRWLCDDGRDPNSLIRCGLICVRGSRDSWRTLVCGRFLFAALSGGNWHKGSRFFSECKVLSYQLKFSFISSLSVVNKEQCNLFHRETDVRALRSLYRCR